MYDFDAMSQFGTIFIAVIFIIVIGSFLLVLFKSITQWQENERSSRLSVAAKVKTKRTEIRRNSEHSHTDYYVIFEVESGDRLEFSVTGREYGQLAEGDNGILSFQGTRYYRFERRLENSQTETI
jgi:uncharacterized protein YpmB